MVSSENLVTLARLATAMEVRRAATVAALETCRQRRERARKQLSLARRLMPPGATTGARFAAWEAASLALEAAETELLALRDEAAVELFFALEPEVRDHYRKMVDTFEMVGAAQVWHAFPTSSTDAKRRSRPRASSKKPFPNLWRSLELTPTRFAIGAAPLFRCRVSALGFGSANGAALYLMPGFLLLHKPGESLALIDAKDLTIQISSLRSSTQDGAAPAIHGEIEIESKTGFYERFVVDDWRALQAFEHALTFFQKSVERLTRAPHETAVAAEIAIPELSLPELPALPQESPMDFRWRLPQWQAPELRLPSWQMPRVRMPRISVPNIAVPRWSFPRVAVPRMAMPKVAIPKVAMPKVRMPRWQMPRVTVPRFPVPAWRWPRVGLPRVRLPDLTLPRVALPRLQLPQWRLPSVSLPRWQAPKLPRWHVPWPDLEVRLRLGTAAAFGFGIVAAFFLFRDLKGPIETASIVAPPQIASLPAPVNPVPVSPEPESAVAAVDRPAAQPTQAAPAAVEGAPALDQDGMTSLVANIVTGAGPTTGGSSSGITPAAFVQPNMPSAIAAQPEPGIVIASRRHPPMLSIGAQPLDTEEVEVLQMKLRALQYYAGAVSGALTDRTVQAFNVWRRETDRAQQPTIDRDDLQSFLVAINR